MGSAIEKPNGHHLHPIYKVSVLQMKPPHANFDFLIQKLNNPSLFINDAFVDGEWVRTKTTFDVYGILI